MSGSCPVKLVSCVCVTCCCSAGSQNDHFSSIINAFLSTTCTPAWPLVQVLVDSGFFVDWFLFLIHTDESLLHFHGFISSSLIIYQTGRQQQQTWSHLHHFYPVPDSPVPSLKWTRGAYQYVFSWHEWMETSDTSMMQLLLHLHPGIFFIVAGLLPNQTKMSSSN